jgi:hypothetical protein
MSSTPSRRNRDLAASSLRGKTAFALEIREFTPKLGCIPHLILLTT